VKDGTAIKDGSGTLLTEQEAVLKVCESYFKVLLNPGGNDNNWFLPSSVGGKIEVACVTI